MSACACLGPKPGHRYCPCMERDGAREPFHIDAGPVYDKVQWTDGLGNKGVMDMTKVKFTPGHRFP